MVSRHPVHGNCMAQLQHDIVEGATKNELEDQVLQRTDVPPSSGRIHFKPPRDGGWAVQKRQQRWLFVVLSLLEEKWYAFCRHMEKSGQILRSLRVENFVHLFCRPPPPEIQ